ncbi:MAG TPA: ATP-binding protein [Steroidobacteraceae bacterium]|nr:ATP-binding protein [Steroidobacteraceae bacterium]
MSLRRHWQSWSIFSRTLLLLVGSLLLVQLISIVLIITLPPPRPFFVGMSELSAVLAGTPPPPSNRHRLDPEAMTVHEATAPPVAEPGMIEVDALTEELAARIGRPSEQLRLYFRPDRGSWLPYRPRGTDAVMRRRGDAIFTDTVLAALDTGAGWRVVRTPDRPLISDWQWRWILWFLLSLLLMLSLAWVFARRLSRPIRNFADAADRIGRDAAAPPVPLEGPVELRVAAQALNGMQARIAEYVRERTAMVAAIAHDLRTPLARIAFRIEGAPDAIREPVHADIREMTAMVTATLEYARGASPHAEKVPVDAGALLGEIAAAARDMGHSVTLDADHGCEVAGDIVALRRLFQNVVDNAMTFGGTAEIEVRREGGAVRVDVADRGPGLPETMLERVFEPFSRNDPSRNRTTGGVGLGLTIARGIARDYGGSVTLANREGGGLVATVRLPLR